MLLLWFRWYTTSAATTYKNIDRVDVWAIFLAWQKLGLPHVAPTTLSSLQGLVRHPQGEREERKKEREEKGERGERREKRERGVL